MDVKLPNLGEGADSGTVVSVLVKPGSPIKKGQNIIELETGKAVAPIPSPATGKVGRIAVKEGDQLGVGQLILVLEGVDGDTGGGEKGEEVSRKPATKPPARPASGRSKGAVDRPAPRAAARSATPDSQARGEGGGLEEIVNENPAAGPYVRRVARDLGIDLRVIAGSGKSGQIGVSDLKEYVARLREAAFRAPSVGGGAPSESGHEPEGTAASASVDFSQWGPVTRKPMSGLRKAIATRMVESATRLPTVTQFHEADLTVVEGLRKKHAGVYEAKGARLTVTSFVLKAVTAMLKKHPLFNASLDEATEEIVFKDYIHLGLAVDTEAGLQVPVLRDVDKKDLLTLSKEVQELAGRARDRKLSLAEMQGGTFTISNQGGIGGGHFTPIINRPESAILGMGRGVLKPVVWEGQIVSRLMLPLALTYDHRLIDGGQAARFMVDLAGALESFDDAEVARSGGGNQ